MLRKDVLFLPHVTLAAHPKEKTLKRFYRWISRVNRVKIATDKTFWPVDFSIRLIP